MDSKVSALPLSGFWTWDHSTNWSADVTKVESGCFNRYAKTPESFLEDYRLLMDAMSAQGIGWLIIWGLLRDSHGGEGAAHELLRLARERGVRVLAGVGVNAYGGVYWEGDHPWNLGTWLRKNPALRAARRKSLMPNSCGRDIACPSKEENIAWARQAVQWLLTRFDVAGMNLETGDYGLCGCDDCRRACGDREAPCAFEDMARVLPPVIDAACAVRPEAVITYATYAPFDSALARTPPAFARTIAPQAVCQWTLTPMAGPAPDGWPEGLRPPTARNVGFSHWGSQWTAPNTRHALIIEHIRNLCRRGARSGLEGIFIHGEVSPEYSFAWRLNYAAFAHFLRRPQDSLEDFAATLGALFGGEEEAVVAVRWLTEPTDSPTLQARIAESLRRHERHAALPHRPWDQVARMLWARTL